MAIASSRHAICILLFVLTHQFAEPALKARRATGEGKPPTPWQNFVRRFQKPFRTVDSALFLLSGGRKAKPATERVLLPVSTESTAMAPKTNVSMEPLVMDPDLTTPKKPLVTKPTATTPSSPVSPEEVPAWNLQRLANDPCGDSPSSLLDGDRLCSLGEFPWMALLRYTAKDKSMVNFCGGSLINERYVLTAASCLEIPEHRLTSVRLGEYNLEFEDSDCTDVEEGLNDEVSIEACYGEPPVDYGIHSAHAHPSYDKTTGENNVGLIRLTKKVAYTPLIRPVCLPVGEMAINWNGGNVEVDLVLAGWGDNVVPREAYTLREDPADCEDAIGDTVSEGQMCASGEDGLALCHGDIGGALVTMTRTRAPPPGDTGSSEVSTRKRYVQLGLLVSKLPYCDESPPLIFDGVERFLPWVVKTMKP